MIDTTLLKCLIACPDGPPAGHVSSRPVGDLADWAATRGTDAVHEYTQDIIDAIVDEIRIPRP